MPRTTSAAVAHLRDVFATDDLWERPGPTPAQRRNDLWIALVVWALAGLGMELFRSFVDATYLDHPGWLYQLLIAVGVLPLVWRRSHPLLVLGLLQAHLFLVGLTVPEVMQSFPMQCVYVFSLFSGVAWARSRQAMVGVVAAVLVLMFGWITWQFALGSAVADLMRRLGEGRAPQGIFPLVAANVAYTVLVNVAFFGGGIVGGQAAWRQARSRDQVERQARQLAEQADELADRRVVEERLRIARELHDVVAHHVSVMGVQAAAARRVLDRNPQAAAAALENVEASSRQAVGEMRGLLGALRRASPPEATPPGDDHRAPQPGIDQIPELVQQACLPGFSVTYEVVEDRPGALTEVPMPVGLSVYRTVQEALANVRRHSTAHRATVAVRLVEAGGRRHVEAEILDDGRPRGGTSGSGLGLLGMRERIASHGGTSEIGPRATGGYRVRVRFPLAAPV
ncbi:sensor histidine kinase [Arsenicicoccus dermatophilus]|uniref:sensor histidine kinase n=1 Tax=Arsenicicoccus dermatophilus TaxID=1076331 RepID=UPI0039171BFD